LGGWISDQLIRHSFSETGTRKMMIVVAFSAGMLMIPATSVRSETLAFAFIIGSSLIGLSTANVTVVIQSCAPPAQLGLWTGIENTAGNLGGVIAPLLMGVLVARTGSYTPGFVLGCVVLLAGAAAYTFILGELKPTTAANEV
jgi:ACS family D-galactonate transporter-like MFS transporter